MAVDPNPAGADESSGPSVPAPSVDELLVRSLGERARAASMVLAGVSSAQKDAALRTAADLLEARAEEVLARQRRRRRPGAGATAPAPS